VPAEPVASLIDVWNAAVAQLKAYLTEAVTVAETDPYSKYEYTKGYRAAMAAVLQLVETMKIVPEEHQQEEEVH